MLENAPHWGNVIATALVSFHAAEFVCKLLVEEDYGGLCNFAFHVISVATYDKAQAMLGWMSFGETPTFDELIAAAAELEKNV